VSFLIEILGNTQLFPDKGFGSAALFPSGSCCCQSCLSSLPDEVSLKFSECTEDMETKFSGACCGINVLGEALKANAGNLNLEINRRLEHGKEINSGKA
jgi:hypothetical protein